jgi:ribonuclease HI
MVSEEENTIKLYFDGASKNNPGKSGAGYWIEYSNSFCNLETCGGYKYLGIQTNNVAEYNGLIIGLKNVIKVDNYSNSNITVYGDSKLVIEQMKGNWKVKSDNLIPLWKEAQELIKNLKINFVHIDRSLNCKADKLANDAINNYKEKVEKVEKNYNT